MYRCNEIVILNRRVAIAVYRTKEGINVLIEGGDKGHIGAVAVARGGEIVESVCFPDTGRILSAKAGRRKSAGSFRDRRWWRPESITMELQRSR